MLLRTTYLLYGVASGLALNVVFPRFSDRIVGVVCSSVPLVPSFVEQYPGILSAVVFPSLCTFVFPISRMRVDEKDTWLGGGGREQAAMKDRQRQTR